MKLFLLAALVHAAYCGVSIQMPYLGSAGVTYVDGSVHAGLAAGPVAYATATARPLAYQAPVAYGAHAVASPLAYNTHAVAAPLAYKTHAVAAPVAYSAPVAYQAYQPVTKYAAVPTVQHVQGHADIPVTRYEAQHGFIQKAVDVAKPAIKTRKFEIRRPAIQKQFYDIEERIIVRPAGSALVELDQPTSKTQQGNAVISPAAYAVPALPAVAVKTVAAVPAYKTIAAVPAFRTAAVIPHVKTVVPAYARLQPFQRFYNPYAVSSVAALAHPQITLAQFGQIPQQQQGQQQPQQEQMQQMQSQENQEQSQGNQEFQQQEQEPQQPQQPYPFEQPQQPQEQQQQQPQQPMPQAPQFNPQPQQDQPQSDDDDDSVSVDNPDFSARSAPMESSSTTTPAPEPETEAEPSSTPAPQDAQASAPLSRSIGTSPFGISAFDLIPRTRSGPSVVPSLRNSAEVSQSNQQRLIELLTARGGVTEVGYGRSGPAINPVGEAGQVRARVLSATPAPSSAEPAGERVNTRRVVVSSPIETLQEIEVQEPVTKLERVHYQHPTLIKTARHDVVRVPTSYPVYGKALAPVAHAAVPVAHAAVPFAHHGVPSYSTYYG